MESRGVIDHLMVFAIFLVENSIRLSIPVIHSPQHFSSFFGTFVSQSGGTLYFLEVPNCFLFHSTVLFSTGFFQFVLKHSKI
jgi:hypothetical protein